MSHKDLTNADFVRIRTAKNADDLDIKEIQALCTLLVDAVTALNRACSHGDPDNSGLCIKCAVVLDSDGPLSVVGLY